MVINILQHILMIITNHIIIKRKNLVTQKSPMPHVLTDKNKEQ